MTPNQRAKKAAKALDLYEQGVNAAMEVVRDFPTTDELRDSVIDDLHASGTAFRALRSLCEQQEQVAKEGTA